jgi:hypothetical protein
MFLPRCVSAIVSGAKKKGGKPASEINKPRNTWKGIAKHVALKLQ